MNRAIKASIAGVSFTAISTFATSARAVNLVRNGEFNPTNSSQTQSSFLRSDPTSQDCAKCVSAITDGSWTVDQPGRDHLVWLSPIGTAAYTNLNAAGSPATYAWALRGSDPIPSADGTAKWFVAADGDPTYASPIRQTIAGLTAGSQYNVSFYQSAAQQNGLTGPTTERWAVSFANDNLATNFGGGNNIGSNYQLSTQMSFPDTATLVLPWQQQTMTFTATATSQVLSFLAVGTPGGQPPISLLSSVSVEAVPTPEPFTIIGTIVGGTAAFRLRKKLAKSSEKA